MVEISDSHKYVPVYSETLHHAPELLLSRREAITAHYAASPYVLEVWAFGSGAEGSCFDGYSDLDMLVICSPKGKGKLLAEVNGLNAISPVLFHQIQYGDSVSLVFADGIVADYGIITPQQFEHLPGGKGRLLWSKKTSATVERIPYGAPPTPQGLWGDQVLWHLLIGIKRELRGEKAAAFCEIQYYGAKELLYGLRKEESALFDPFRRAEAAGVNPGSWLPGYAKSVEAAAAIQKSLPPEACTPKFYDFLERLCDAAQKRGV